LPRGHVFQARERLEFVQDRVLRVIDEPIAQRLVLGERQQTRDDPLSSVETAPQQIADPPVAVEKRLKMCHHEAFQLASPGGNIGN
jgi:hypothetical protein